MNKRKCLLVFLFTLCFSFFMIGCKKKESTTNKNTTIKPTTEKQNSSSTNKTTSSTTTKKTTAKPTTTEVNTKTTSIDLFESYSSLSVSIKYSEDGSIKTTSESTYIEENTPIDITFTYFSDYLITITDGDTVNTYYLFYNGSSISLGGEEITPQTFEIKEYLPKTKLVKIENKGLDSYAIFYDKNVDDVTMELNGSTYAYKANAYEKEGKKVNAKIKNNSGNRVLFEIYKYDEESNPTIFVDSQIINVNATYEIPEFTMPTYKLCFRVSAYITYTITYDEMFATNENLTYDIKAILNDDIKTVTDGEYLDGTKLKISITNNTNQMLALCIRTESRSILFNQNVLPNTKYEMPDDGLFIVDKNILIESELVDCYKLTLASSCPSYLGIKIYDYNHNGYNFGDYIRKNYMAIALFNESDTKTVGVYAYNEMDVPVNYYMVRNGESKTMTFNNINMDLHVVIEEYDEPQKFKTIIDNGAGATIKAYARYDYSTEVDINSEFDWATSITLEISNPTSKRIVAKAVDYKGEIIACIPVAPGGAKYLNYQLERDVTVYIDNDVRSVFLIGASFGFQGEIITVFDVNGATVELENKILLVDKGTKLFVKVECPGYTEKVRVENLAGGSYICDEVKVNKGSSVTFELTMDYDACVTGYALM